MDAQHHRTVPDLDTPELAQDHPSGIAPRSTTYAGNPVTTQSEDVSNLENVTGSTGIRSQCITYQWPADANKRFAALRVHLAQEGFSLHRTAAADGPVCFYVARWGMACELHDLAAVAQFLKRVGGAHA